MRNRLLGIGILSLLMVCSTVGYSNCHDDVQFTWRVVEKDHNQITYQWTAIKTNDVEGSILVDFYFGADLVHQLIIEFYLLEESEEDEYSNKTANNESTNPNSSDTDEPEMNPLHYLSGSFTLPAGKGIITHYEFYDCTW